MPNDMGSHEPAERGTVDPRDETVFLSWTVNRRSNVVLYGSGRVRGRDGGEMGGD